MKLTSLSPLFAPFLVSLAAGCAGDSAGGTANTTTGFDTSGTGESSSTGGQTKGAASSDGGASDTGSDSDGMDASSSGSTSSDGATSTDTGDPDPADLPFGGVLNWRVSLPQQQVNGVGVLYGRSYGANVEIPREALPLQPYTEDVWHIPPSSIPPSPPFTRVPYAISPEFSLSNGSVSLAYSRNVRDPESVWLAPVVPFARAAEAGPWTLTLPSYEDAPEATFENLFPGADGAVSDTVELVRDRSGIPIAITWDPSVGGTFMSIAMSLSGPNDEDIELCWGIVEDDGEVTLPAACTGEGVDLNPSLYNSLDVVMFEAFEDDIAYDGHRIRLFETMPIVDAHHPFPFTAPAL